MSDLPIPNAHIEVAASVQSRSTTSRASATFQCAAHASDSGLILTEPSGYYTNLSLAGARSLAAWLGEWVKYQQSRFKPTGWRLVNILNGSTQDVSEGHAVALIGDSFYIKGINGEALTQALPATDWELRPIVPATATE